MSKLVARIVLAIFMIPAAAIVYLIFFAINERNWRSNGTALFLITGAIVWGFMALYWTLLWIGVVRMSGQRVMFSILAALGACAFAAVCRAATVTFDREFGAFVASIVAPISWLIAVTLLWRETADERAERLKSLSKSAIVCPKCGYNLTGLSGSRCPECGTQYTLDELLVGQPSRAGSEVT